MCTSWGSIASELALIEIFIILQLVLANSETHAAPWV